LPALQTALELSGRRGERVHRGVRRSLLEAREDLRQKGDFADVGHGDGGGELRRRRVERQLRQQLLLEPRQNLAGGRQESARARSGLHAGAAADEQLIAELTPELAERSADRGLADAEPAGRPGRVALLAERGDDREEVQVELLAHRPTD